MSKPNRSHRRRLSKLAGKKKTDGRREGPRRNGTSGAPARPLPPPTETTPTEMTPAETTPTATPPAATTPTVTPPAATPPAATTPTVTTPTVTPPTVTPPAATQPAATTPTATGSPSALPAPEAVLSAPPPVEASAEPPVEAEVEAALPIPVVPETPCASSPSVPVSAMPARPEASGKGDGFGTAGIPEVPVTLEAEGTVALSPEVERELSSGTRVFRPPEGWADQFVPPVADARSDGWFPRLRTGLASQGDEDPVEAVVEMVERVPEDKRMHIVMITPEIAPVAKVGGLGDMVVGLGRELVKRGHRVELVAPMYHGLRREGVENFREYLPELAVPHGDQWVKESVFAGAVSGLPCFFVTAGLYTLRPNIYGYEDDIRRFAFFTRAAMEFLHKSERRPHILHAHDWSTALAPVLLYDIYAPLGWNRTRAVFTIHNNECQGVTDDAAGVLGLVGLDWRQYLRPDRLQDDTDRNAINLMKGAIVYSNFVTAVSPTYAGEIKTPMGGRGLHGVLSAHSTKVGGVINGIDFDVWDPATDTALAAKYSDGDDFIEKYRNKYALRERLELADGWKPIVGVVTRLTEQKGLSLIRAAVELAPEMEAQFVVLGSAPDPRVDREFQRLAAELADNRDVHLWLGYNEELAHLIYAGCDMFLIPSLYEPCGLTQMIAMHYGTVPIARRTGGLADTVVDAELSGRGPTEANGFLFSEPTPEALGKVMRRAVRLWYEEPKAFGLLARNGMRKDFSWRHPAKDYENIYHYIRG